MNAVTLMTPEAQHRLPDVDEVLYLGYAVHAADDNALEGTHDQKLARTALDDFMALKGSSDAEQAYIRCAWTVAVSHGRGIRRRKREWEQTKDAAAAERAGKLSRIRESRQNSSFINVAWRQAFPVAVGMFGYVFAHAVSNWVPPDVAQATGSKLPSFAMALLFGAIGRGISNWWSDWQSKTIETEYHKNVYRADLNYEKGKRDEGRLYRAQLKEAWKQYTGQVYPDKPSYQLIILGDIESRRRSEQARLLYEQNPASYILGKLPFRRRTEADTNGASASETSLASAQNPT